MAIVLFVIGVANVSKSLAWTFASGAAAVAILIFLHQGRYLPRSIMDVLDRLTNRQTLEAAYRAKERRLITFDAKDLARRIRARVVGQDEAIEAVATQLRR